MLRPEDRETLDKLLMACASCDFGLDEYGCNCYNGDPRPAVSRLLEEYDEAQKVVDYQQKELKALSERLSERTAERDELLKHVPPSGEYERLKELVAGVQALVTWGIERGEAEAAVIGVHKLIYGCAPYDAQHCEAAE